MSPDCFFMDIDVAAFEDFLFVWMNLCTCLCPGEVHYTISTFDHHCLIKTSQLFIFFFPADFYVVWK